MAKSHRRGPLASPGWRAGLSEQAVIMGWPIAGSLAPSHSLKPLT